MAYEICTTVKPNPPADDNYPPSHWFSTQINSPTQTKWPDKAPRNHTDNQITRPNKAPQQWALGAVGTGGVETYKGALGVSSYRKPWLNRATGWRPPQVGGLQLADGGQLWSGAKGEESPAAPRSYSRASSPCRPWPDRGRDREAPRRSWAARRGLRRRPQRRWPRGERRCRRAVATRSQSSSSFEEPAGA
jgi:hypothetical protein